MKVGSRIAAEIIAAVEGYTGLKQPTLEIHPDPAIDGVYAVQCDTSDGTHMQKAQFLLTRAPRTVYDFKTETPEEQFEIEEVTFTKWPPVVRR